MDGFHECGLPKKCNKSATLQYSPGGTIYYLQLSLGSRLILAAQAGVISPGRLWCNNHCDANKWQEKKTCRGTGCDISLSIAPFAFQLVFYAFPSSLKGGKNNEYHSIINITSTPRLYPA